MATLAYASPAWRGADAPYADTPRGAALPAAARTCGAAVVAGSWGVVDVFLMYSPYGGRSTPHCTSSAAAWLWSGICRLECLPGVMVSHADFLAAKRLHSDQLAGLLPRRPIACRPGGQCSPAVGRQEVPTSAMATRVAGRSACGANEGDCRGCPSCVRELI